MPVCPDAPEKIFRKRIKETLYIDYEYDRVYDAKRKFNIPKRAAIRNIIDSYGFGGDALQALRQGRGVPAGPGRLFHHL
ncbi:MAG TPA: hypothetical protein DCG32_05460 [Sphaerochaeta sp.]|nr:hypothetical protein [Sphaerochaeta sp.]